MNLSENRLPQNPLIYYYFPLQVVGDSRSQTPSSATFMVCFGPRFKALLAARNSDTVFNPTGRGKGSLRMSLLGLKIGQPKTPKYVNIFLRTMVIFWYPHVSTIWNWGKSQSVVANTWLCYGEMKSVAPAWIQRGNSSHIGFTSSCQHEPEDWAPSNLDV